MAEQEKRIRVRIQNDGEPGYRTRISDAETGQAIDYVRSVQLSGLAVDTAPLARIEVWLPIVDVVVDAEITHVCPYCQRAMETDEKAK